MKLTGITIIAIMLVVMTRCMCRLCEHRPAVINNRRQHKQQRPHRVSRQQQLRQVSRQQRLQHQQRDLP